MSSRTPHSLPEEQLPVSKGDASWRINSGLMICLLLGALYRELLGLHAAVEHFDEGVYASNLWFEARDFFTYPLRWFYAPPLLPWLIENLFVIGGASNSYAILPTFVAACLTLFLVWSAGERWVSLATGSIALLLGAFSAFHGNFSNTALTDPLLGLWMLASLIAFEKGCRQKSLPWGVAAGLLCGLAWLTKYNGWLCLPIALGGLVLASLISPQWRRKESWLVFFLMLVTASAVWSPYLWSLQSHGGYAAISAHHRTYFVGLPGWGKSCVQQFENLRYFDGPHSSWVFLALGLLIQQRLGFLCSTWNIGKLPRDLTTTTRRDHRILLGASLLTILGIATGITTLTFLLALAWIITRIRDYQAGVLNPEKVLGNAILIVWLIGLAVLIPLYTPYPRLLIPWLIPVWLAGGAGFENLMRSLPGDQPSHRRLGWTAGVALVTSLLCLGVDWGMFVSKMRDPHQPVLQRRDSQQRMAQELTNKVLTPEGEGQNKSSKDAVIAILADPALFFQLRLQGFRNTTVQGSLSFLHHPLPPDSPQTYLILGGEASADSGIQKQLEDSVIRIRRVYDFKYVPSDIVLLDRYSPGQLRATPTLREQHVLVYELLRN